MKIQMIFDFAAKEPQRERDVVERYFTELVGQMIPTFEFKGEFKVDDEVVLAAVGKNCGGTILNAETIRTLFGMVGEKKIIDTGRGVGEK